MLKALILVVSAVSPLVSSGYCPGNAYTFSPCTCSDSTYSGVQCYYANATQLKNAFESASQQVSPDQKDLDCLTISDYAEEIPAQATADFTFQTINIGNKNGYFNPNLTRIHSDAFKFTASKVQEFYIYDGNTNLVSSDNQSYNIFTLINSMGNVRKVQITSPKLLSIPDRAFEPVNRAVPMTQLTFGGSSQLAPKERVSIGNDAFYELKNLNQLILKSNRINSLLHNSMHFKWSSSQLFVDLSDNQLNSLSFDGPETLAQFNRNVSLKLDMNDLTYLDSTVFKPFLDTNTGSQVNGLTWNPLNCSDCRNAWLAMDKKKYQDRVLGAYCDSNNEGPTVFDHNYPHCPIAVWG